MRRRSCVEGLPITAPANQYRSLSRIAQVFPATTGKSIDPQIASDLSVRISSHRYWCFVIPTIGSDLKPHPWIVHGNGRRAYTSPPFALRLNSLRGLRRVLERYAKATTNL